MPIGDLQKKYPEGVEIINSLKLDSGNYHSDVFDKKQIVICNSLSDNMSHIDLWRNKINGEFKGTAPYTISMDGKIYEHYDPKFYSEFIGIDDFDKQVIPIVLENEGWLIKDYNKNELLTWCGDIYNREGGNFVKIKWRGKLRWAPYTKPQFDSLVELTDYLIDKFNINRFVSEHNTKIVDIHEKEGIYYRSNYNINYLDVSPAFNCKELKIKIENNGKLK